MTPTKFYMVVFVINVILVFWVWGILSFLGNSFLNSWIMIPIAAFGEFIYLSFVEQIYKDYFRKV